MRVLFLTHYFHPEGNAPGTRVYQLCTRWVAMGHDVTVVTGVPHVSNGVAYEGNENSWLQKERVDGIGSIAAFYDYDRLAEKYPEIIERVAVAGNSRLRG